MSEPFGSHLAFMKALNAIPFARPHFRRRDSRSWRAAAAAYNALQYRKAYGIPAGLNGNGQIVGIIELGGAWSQNDYASYMTYLGIGTVDYLMPVVLGSPQDDPGGANVEVMLDSCVIGGLASMTQQRIYFAPNTDAGFAGAVQQAIDDGCDAVSISWGASEKQWSAQSRQMMDNALSNGVNKGVATFASSGDNGSTDGGSGNNTDYPASSPLCVGCGGTRTILNSDGSIASEVAWSDGGGGFSAVYSKPDYQATAVNGTFRGVPDVAGPADPQTGWIIQADGALTSVGGTSAVSPMWAALQCLLNQKAGKRTAWLNRLSYANPGWFRDVLGGSNGAYTAGPGWDACTGMGTPNGLTLFGSGTPTPTPTPTPVPTPVPVPPPPTPTPTPTPIPPGLKQQIDAVFLALESQFRYYPPIVRVLKYAQSQVDRILGQYGAHAATEMWGNIPPTVVLIVNAALDQAAVQYPEYAPLILLVKAAVDQFLPLL